MAQTFNTIGDRLRDARESKCLTQKQLSDITNITVATISRYENNQREMNADYIMALCDALDISADWLLRGTYKHYEKRSDLSLYGLTHKLFYSLPETPGPTTIYVFRHTEDAEEWIKYKYFGYGNCKQYEIIMTIHTDRNIIEYIKEKYCNADIEQIYALEAN